MVNYRDLLKKHLIALSQSEKGSAPKFTPEEEAEIQAIFDEAHQNQISGGMSPDRALDLLQAVKATEMDAEDGHIMADTILCSLLEFLGHHAVVEAWKEVPKEYD